MVADRPIERSRLAERLCKGHSGYNQGERLMLDTVMAPRLIDRRLFLGATAGAGALALLPRAAFARLAATDPAAWAKVQANLDAYVADGRLPGAAAAIGRGTGPAQFIS